MYCPLKLVCKSGTSCVLAANAAIPLAIPVKVYDGAATYYFGTQYYLQCAAGTYGKFDMLDAATGSARSCEPCPAGYKCPTTGMMEPIPCGKGFYSAASHATATCLDCPVGHYCEREDTSDTMKDANTCQAGYLCPLNTVERPFFDIDD